MRNLKIWLHSIAILLIALSLRIIRMGTESPGLEEVYAMLHSAEPLSQYRMAEGLGFCPPVLYFLLQAVQASGGALIGMRFASVIAGALAALLIYHVGRTLFDHRAGALAGYLLAVNPLHVFFSQEIQGLVWFTAFGASALYFLIKSAETMRFRHWLLFDIFTILMLHTWREAPFTAVAFLIVHLSKVILFSDETDQQRKGWKSRQIRLILFNYATIVAVSAPWLMIMPHKVPWFVAPPRWADVLKLLWQHPLMGMTEPSAVMWGLMLLIFAGLLPPAARMIREFEFRSIAVLFLAIICATLPLIYSMTETPRHAPARDAAAAVAFGILVIALLISRCNLYVRTILVALLLAVFTRAIVKQADSRQKTWWHEGMKALQSAAPADSLVVVWPDFALPLGKYYLGTNYELVKASDFFGKWGELAPDKKVFFTIAQFPSKTPHLYMFSGALNEHAQSRTLWTERLNRIVESGEPNRIALDSWYKNPMQLNIVDLPTSDTQFNFTADKPDYKKDELFHWERTDVTYDSRGRRLVWTSTDHVVMNFKVTLAPGNYVLKMHCTPDLELQALGKTYDRSVSLELSTGINSRRWQLDKEQTVRLTFDTETELNDLPITIDISPMLKLNEPVRARYGIGIYSIAIDLVPEGV